MKTETAPLNLRLELRRAIDAPVERVFAAWTDLDKFTAWLGSSCFKLKHAEGDIRVGGSFHIEGTGCESGSDTILEGRYREIVPNSRLVFTWAHQTPPMNAEGETVVTVDFKAVGRKTEIHLVHEGFVTEQAREGHNDGWNTSFDRLAQNLA
ncbi:MAG: SRPBCC domain-containing protein [Methylacidiphilales bacterium]|nr:SRPBCC domain-containing protein [Candidatus Methylacidiphilales bacterium]